MTDADEAASEARINRLIELYQRATGSSAAGNSITVHVNAGGVGVWIATTCAIAMLVAGLIGAIWMANEFRRYDDQLTELRQRDRVHDAYIQATYRGEKKPEK